MDMAQGTRGMTLTWDYGWRLFATALCFTAFGLGGLLLTVAVFPALLLFRKADRIRHARRLIQRVFAGFLRLAETLGVMRLHVSGAHRLRDCGGALVLANHPTLIDVVVLLSLMPTAGCVVKRALWKNPVLGAAVRAAGYISNSEPETLVGDCTRALAEGRPLIIFPEGTRSQPGQPLRFLRGASYIAIASGAPVVPVLIGCRPSTLTKQDKWYRIPPRRFDLRVEVLEPLARWHADAGDAPSALAARHLTQSLETHFTREIQRHEFTEA